mgnify:CR=1 FL=1
METHLIQSAIRIRQRILSMCVKAGTGHVTSSFSCVEILTALYHGGVLKHDPNRPDWPDRDRFILSKGQASPALYAVLADRGYFPDEWLDGFAQAGGRMGVHLQRSVPGAEITCGSLGQGFGLAVGMALAAKMEGQLMQSWSHRVFTLLGDGECWEGSVCEAAMFAAHHQLFNLIAIIDRNQMSVMGKTEEIVKLEPLRSKWQAFGWRVREIDGHDSEAILGACMEAREVNLAERRPTMIIAETIKGYPIKEVEGQALWHGVAPSEEVGRRWMEELKGGTL